MELETSNRRAKPHPGSIAVFFCARNPGTMAGRLGQYNTCLQEIAKAAPVAGFNLLAALNKGLCDLKLATGKNMKTRYLKVRKTYRDYFLKNKPYQGNPSTAYILLKGNWLEKTGFIIDTPLSVTVHKNRLVLEPRNE